MGMFDYSPDISLPKQKPIKLPKVKLPSSRRLLPRKRDIQRAISFKRVREPISAKLRDIVLARAKNKCEWKGCNIKNGEVKLKFHHKDMNNDHNTPGNIMALCSYHHDLIHARYKKVAKRDILNLCEESNKVVTKKRAKEIKKRGENQNPLLAQMNWRPNGF